MISFEDVSFSYESGKPILRNISMTVGDGEAVGIIGANGTGKSTLVKILLGLLKCQGQVVVDALPVRAENFSAIRKKIGYVLQDSDNQMFMPTVYEDMCFGPRNYGLSRKETDIRIERILSELGIVELKEKYNHKISGGEKRMAAIATVLAMDPSVIIMDEPSIALDPFNRRAVIHTINGLDITKLIVSHDLDLVMDTCSRVVLMSGGRIAADGPADVILRDRELLENNRMELPLRFQG